MNTSLATTPALEPCLPDYAGGSIVNLMTSIAAAFGTSNPASLPLRGQALAAALTVEAAWSCW